MANPTSPQLRRLAPNGDGATRKHEADEHTNDPASLIDLQVARRIRTQRLRSGMTLQTLAQGIGVAFQQAHKYERGQSRISAGRLFHIAKVLGAPITYFFVPDEEPHASEQPALPDRVDR